MSVLIEILVQILVEITLCSLGHESAELVGLIFNRAAEENLHLVIVDRMISQLIICCTRQPYGLVVEERRCDRAAQETSPVGEGGFEFNF